MTATSQSSDSEADRHSDDRTGYKKCYNNFFAYCYSGNLIQRCSGAGTHGNAIPTLEIEWERCSHKKNFERYIFIIAIKLAIFYCYHMLQHSVHLKPCQKLDIRICKALAH